jgi:hypothetical protein
MKVLFTLTIFYALWDMLSAKAPNAVGTTGQQTIKKHS